MPVEIATGVYKVQIPQTPQYENSRAGGYTSVYTNVKYQQWGIAVENVTAKRADVERQFAVDVEMYKENLDALNRLILEQQKIVNDLKEGKISHEQAVQKYNNTLRNRQNFAKSSAQNRRYDAKVMSEGQLARTRKDYEDEYRQEVQEWEDHTVVRDSVQNVATASVPGGKPSMAIAKGVNDIRKSTAIPAASKQAAITAYIEQLRQNPDIDQSKVEAAVEADPALSKAVSTQINVVEAPEQGKLGPIATPEIEELKPDASYDDLIAAAEAEIEGLKAQKGMLDKPELAPFDPLAAARLEYAEKFPSLSERRSQKKASDTLTAFYDAEIQKELDKLPPDATPADRAAARQRGIDNVQAFFTQVSPPPKTAEEIAADQEERRKESARMRAAEEDFRTEEEFRRTATDDQLRARELQDRRDQINRKTDELEQRRSQLLSTVVPTQEVLKAEADQMRASVAGLPPSSPEVTQRLADAKALEESYDPELARGMQLQIDDELREIDRKLGILTEGDARIGQELATLRERDPELLQAAEQERLVEGPATQQLRATAQKLRDSGFEDEAARLEAEADKASRAALGLQFPGSAQLQDARPVDQAAVSDLRQKEVTLRNTAFDLREVGAIEQAEQLEAEADRLATEQRSLTAQPRQTQAVREAQVRAERAQRERDRADAVAFRERSLFDPEAEAARIEAERMEAQGRGLIGEEQKVLEETRQQFDLATSGGSLAEQRRPPTFLTEEIPEEQELLKKAEELRMLGLEDEAQLLVGEAAKARRRDASFRTGAGDVVMQPQPDVPVSIPGEIGEPLPEGESKGIIDTGPAPERPYSSRPLPQVGAEAVPSAPVVSEPPIDNIEFQPAAPAQEGQFTGVQTTTPQEPTDLPVQTVEQQGAQFMLEASKQADMLSKQPRKVKRLTSNTQYGPVVEQMYLTNKQLDKPQTTQVMIEKIQETYRDDPETQENAVELYLALEQLDKRSGTAGVRPEDNVFK